MRIGRILAAVGLATLGVAIAAPASAAGPLYFPPAAGEWQRVAPADAGWDAAALQAALSFAQSAHSSAVVILLEGRILAEGNWAVTGSARYDRLHAGKTPDGHAIEDVASAQKSVVAFLAGIAEGKKQLDLDASADRYLGTGWSKAAPDAEAKITVRHLMTMTTGLSDALVYQQPAGSIWRYNTGAYSRTVGVIEKATGKDINALTAEWLTGPAGMKDSTWATRPWSAGQTAANSIGFTTTARDLARFGLVILAGGTWDGKDLLNNPTYLKRALSPSQEMNPSYGFLWWLNGHDFVVPGPRSRERAGSMIPSAPDDLVAAQGALGRKCYVVPSLGLVVTRMGDEPGEAFNEDFWALLMKAAPKQTK